VAIIQLGCLWSDCTNVGLVHSCDMIYAIVCIQYRESMPQKTFYTELYMSSVTKQAHIRTYGFKSIYSRGYSQQTEQCSKNKLMEVFFKRENDRKLLVIMEKK